MSNKKKINCTFERFNIEYLQNNICGIIGNKPIFSKKLITIKSPIDLQNNGNVYAMSAIDVQKAYEGAFDIFKKWSKTLYDKRKKILLKFADLLIKNRTELAKLLVNHIAKSFNESILEIERSVEYIYETIKIYEKLITKPKIIDYKIHGIKNKIGYFTREPLGIILAITPFNYPVNTVIAKIIPALIAGNVVVFKPASQASIIGIKLTELMIKSGIPQHVFNCIVGTGNDIGQVLINNKHINMISFTGSTEIGYALLKNSSVGNVCLELGGKDAAIVLNDADVKLTVNEIIKGAFLYSGQRCTAIKRVLVLKQIAPILIKSLKENISQLVIDNPIKNPDIVPLINLKSAKYVESLIKNAKQCGAKIEIGGTREKNWVKPTLITKVTPKMRIAWEEPFGPVLPIIEVKNIKEAIKIHNASKYGLQASIFCKKEKNALDIAKELEVGTVNWNRSSSRGPDVFPFLGIKDSGIGTQGIEDAILSMTRYKGFIVNK